MSPQIIGMNRLLMSRIIMMKAWVRQKWTSPIFMIIFLRMVFGPALHLMDMFGFPTVRDMVGAPIPMAVGFGPTTAGLGYPSTNGDGLLFIMDAGDGMSILAGIGNPEPFGDRHG